MTNISTPLRLCLIMVCSILFPSTSNCQTVGDTFTDPAFTYKVLAVDVAAKRGLVELTGLATEVGESLVIPAAVSQSFDGEEWTFAVSAIGASAFAECKKLQTVKFPALEETSLTTIGPLAFHHCTALRSLNLEDTKIEVLESLFTKDDAEEMYFEELTELKLPETLKEIKSFAMQFLGIRTMTIPASVTTIGEGILEGNIYLEEFYWKGAKVNKLPLTTFLGDDALQKVYFLTDNDIDPNGLTDMHFYMCHKEMLTVYVTPSSYSVLTANGYDNETSVFSTIAVDEEWTAIQRSHAATPESAFSTADKYQATYSLQGSRITYPRKGTLYIRDGRKYMAR